MHSNIMLVHERMIYTIYFLIRKALYDLAWTCVAIQPLSCHCMLGLAINRANKPHSLKKNCPQLQSLR